MTVKENFYNMFYKGDIKEELKEVGQDYDKWKKLAQNRYQR